jgi:hypothetical protein
MQGSPSIAREAVSAASCSPVKGHDRRRRRRKAPPLTGCAVEAERDALLTPATETEGMPGPQAMLLNIKGIGPEFARAPITL